MEAVANADPRLQYPEEELLHEIRKVRNFSNQNRNFQICSTFQIFQFCPIFRFRPTFQFCPTFQFFPNFSILSNFSILTTLCV